MNGANEKIRYLREQLALHGSIFSCEDIQAAFNALQDVSLKLIVANVPLEVFSNSVAKDAFEALYKSFDAEATFIYLPSFKRAQVFMKHPESAICARLQTQGWTCPQSVISQLPDDCPRSPFHHEGLNCFIDHASHLDSDSDDPENFNCGSRSSSSSGDGDLEMEDIVDPNEPCTCLALGILDDLTTQHPTHPAPPSSSELECDGRFTSNTSTSAGSLGDHQTSWMESGGSRATPEGQETTSEASGDDGASRKQPIPSSVLPPPASSTVQQVECKRHGRVLFSDTGRRALNKAKRGAKMKHLAPPKPSRLFLLSPPASPPVGWEPKPECEPVINYELLEALASLAPGESFEVHPHNKQQQHPSIVITPCDHATEKGPAGSRPRIVQTRCPNRTIR